MIKYEYIEKVMSHISNEAEKMSIKEELLNHIEDEEMRYKDAGYTLDYASDKALSLMGNQTKLAKN